VLIAKISFLIGLSCPALSTSAHQIWNPRTLNRSSYIG
jgi:hypothetical protein